MNRYEYRILQTDISEIGHQELEARLNVMGGDGWNLVATIPHERHGYSHEVHLLFSRCVGDVAVDRSKPAGALQDVGR